MYANEVRDYDRHNQPRPNLKHYETDLLVTERLETGGWTPRVVVETKLKTVNTHDSITYSQKAGAHKNVHPYLRYGILIGNRGAQALPGRLFRHGAQFDFMMVIRGIEATPAELDTLVDLLSEEAEASRLLERIVFDTHSRSRSQYTVLRKTLRLF